MSKIKSVYENFLSEMNEKILNKFVSGDISESDSKTLSDCLNYENKKDLRDVINMILEKLKNSNHKYSENEIEKIIIYYLNTSNSIVSDETKEKFIKEIIENYANDNHFYEPEEYTSKIGNTIGTENKRDNLISKIQQLKKSIERALARGNTTYLATLLPKISNLSNEILDFVIKVNNSNIYNGQTMMENVAKEFNELCNSLGKTGYPDKTTSDAANEIMSKKDNINNVVKYSYDNVMKILDKLFANKETVTLEELLTAFDKTHRPKDIINLPEFVRALEEYVENETNSHGVAGSRGFSGLAASQARLLLNILNEGLEKGDLPKGDATLIEITEYFESQNDGTVIELINADSLISNIEIIDDTVIVENDSIAQEISTKFKIQLRNVPISYIIGKLKNMFERRTDITKEKVVNAMTAIYMNYAIEQKYKELTEKVTTHDSKYTNKEYYYMRATNIYNNVNSYIEDSFKNFNYDYDIVASFGKVLDCLNNIMYALINNDFHDVIKNIKDLQNELENINK